MCLDNNMNKKGIASWLLIIVVSLAVVGFVSLSYVGIKYALPGINQSDENFSDVDDTGLGGGDEGVDRDLPMPVVNGSDKTSTTSSSSGGFGGGGDGGGSGCTPNIHKTLPF